tara:strand:- start:895 stop:2043 length:1149 start_codon:yes stop_codon:yes gene_type:complete
MKKINRLQCLALNYITASVKDRTYFSFSDEEKKDLHEVLYRELSIPYVLITTCNRTELYFESKQVSPKDVRAVLTHYVESKHNVSINEDIFIEFDTTEKTIAYLLEVSSGLRSSVIGDKQIIQQVRESFKEALKYKRQGSLLERSFQTVFRTHKSIVSNTKYYAGSNSTAYTALKLAKDYFKSSNLANYNLLIIGAGEIAQDVLQYLKKFSFNKVGIANRTFSRAKDLSQKFNIETYDWNLVTEGNFGDFDFIISAVSNRHHLITSVNQSPKSRLWVDMAVPNNIHSNIENEFNALYNIDEISSYVRSNQNIQNKEVEKVRNIIAQETASYLHWVNKKISWSGNVENAKRIDGGNLKSQKNNEVVMSIQDSYLPYYLNYYAY